MALPRKDLRIKLDHDMHESLAVLAESDGVEMAAWAERVLVAEISRRVQGAIFIARRTNGLGSIRDERRTRGTGSSGE